LDHLAGRTHNSAAPARRLAASPARSYRDAGRCATTSTTALIARVVAIPPSRAQRTESLRDGPRPTPGRPPRSRHITWTAGHAYLDCGIQTGLRVSELSVRNRSLVGHRSPHSCTGQVQEQSSHACPRAPVGSCGSGCVETRQGSPPILFPPNRRGTTLTRGAWGSKNQKRHCREEADARPSAPSGSTPHVLRHTCAMQRVAIGVDTAVIDLWLGPKSGQTDRSDLPPRPTCPQGASTSPERPLATPAGRYRPLGPQLLAFLEAVTIGRPPDAQPALSRDTPIPST